MSNSLHPDRDSGTLVFKCYPVKFKHWLLGCLDILINLFSSDIKSLGYV